MQSYHVSNFKMFGWYCFSYWSAVYLLLSAMDSFRLSKLLLWILQRLVVYMNIPFERMRYHHAFDSKTVIVFIEQTFGITMVSGYIHLVWWLTLLIFQVKKLILGSLMTFIFILSKKCHINLANVKNMTTFFDISDSSSLAILNSKKVYFWVLFYSLKFDSRTLIRQTNWHHMIENPQDQLEAHVKI